MNYNENSDSDSIIKGGTISIGNNEKHEISFGIPHVPTASPSGLIKFREEPYLFIDDTEIKLHDKKPTFNKKLINRKISFFSGSIELKLEIGDFEKHKVEIKYAVPPILGYFFKSTNRFVVRNDGQVVYDKDKLSWWSYLFMYLPFIFFFGGVIPMLIGLSGVCINYNIISRHKLNKAIRLVLLTSITLIYLIIAIIYAKFISEVKRK